MPRKAYNPDRPKAAIAAPAAGPSESAGSRMDRELVARAYRKRLDHQDLTREERAAVARHEKALEEQRRWQYYSAIPQKHWKEMSGRQTKVINEQADRYGLPFGGPFTNLPKFVRAFHDFLAENAMKLARDDEADPLLQGSGSPALESYREERAALARLDRLEREGLLLPRDKVREALGRVAAIIRAAGDALQRQFGLAALELLNESLDDAEREVERSFGDQNGDSGDSTEVTPDAGDAPHKVPDTDGEASDAG
jgi:hypothetical protein